MINSNKGKIRTIELTVCLTSIEFGIDTGSAVNIIDEQTFNHLQRKPKLDPSYTRLYPYMSKTPLATLGQFKTRFRYNNTSFECIFQVVSGDAGCILGDESSTLLGLVTYNINTVTTNHKLTYGEELAKQYPKLFSNKIGKFNKFQVKLTIDPKVTPVRQKARPIPFHLRERVEIALQKLLNDDIIEPVIGPTTWISPIVPVIKPNGDIRICTDARQANTAISREALSIKTVEEIATKMNGANFFSKLDLRAGYNQIELAPESRSITAFATHIGLFQNKRLTIGIGPSGDFFNTIVTDEISGIADADSISDDIMVSGSTETKHDKTLHQVLQRLEDAGFTLNIEKCIFKQPELVFFGLHFSEIGVKLSEEKTLAILNAAKPTRASELHSLVGLVNYASKFIPNAATIIHPFRELMKQNARWAWNEVHDNALAAMKKALTTEAMGYFDKSWDTEVTTDASPFGLGAILAQIDPKDSSRRRIIAYASRRLSEVESRYAQVEREALGLVWACEKFRLYLIGRWFYLVTDNKPVEIIFRNPKSKTSARIERWCLRMVPYQFFIRHEQGISNIVDYIANNPLLDAVQQDCSEELLNHIEAHINLLVDVSVPSSLRLSAIIRETLADDVLQLVKRFIRGETINDIKLKLFISSRDLLSESEEGLLLYERRIVIPSNLHKHVLEIAHEGHQGFQKSYALLEQYVWFPMMHKIMKEHVERCIVCKTNSETKVYEPLKMSPLPSGPWEEVCVDFHGPVGNGEYIMVLIDEYSRFPIIKIISTTAGHVVIPALREIFAVFGTPTQVKSDNGPPFQGHKFKEFSGELGFKHRKITPEWPKANAICERFMRPINRVIRNAKATNKNWKIELQTFLMIYRLTPHTSTGIAPSKLFLKTHKTSGKLPQYDKPSEPDSKRLECEAYMNDKKSKSAIKLYADTRFKSKCSTLKVGDLVLYRWKPLNKSTPRFEPTPYTIVKINGSQVTVENVEHRITRNSSVFQAIEKHNTIRGQVAVEPPTSIITTPAPTLVPLPAAPQITVPASPNLS